MKITDIRPRRKGLSAVYIDGEYALSLDTQTLLEHRIDIGREFDDEELHDLIESSNERRAKEKALWLISYRSHSKKELRDKISRTCDRQSAEKAVERMEELTKCSTILKSTSANRYRRLLNANTQKSMTKKSAAAPSPPFKGWATAGRTSRLLLSLFNTGAGVPPKIFNF